MFDTVSEKLVIILGGLGTLFLGSAAWIIDKESISDHEILALVQIFNHFILIVIALPFMLSTLFEQTETSKAYLLLLNIESLLNAIFITLFALQTPDRNLFLNFIVDSYIFMMMALLEFVPLYLTIYQLKNRTFIFTSPENIS